MKGYLSKEETDLSNSFLKNGYVIIGAEAPEKLTQICDHAAGIAAKHLGLKIPNDTTAFLNDIHKHIDNKELNELRLAVFEGLNSERWFRPAYFALMRRTLEVLVGNELAMQLRVNLSVQLPGDQNSLLPVHSDVWNGDSAYEVVAWLPLVNCYRTKSMYLLPPEANARASQRLSDLGNSSEEVFRAIERDVVYLDVPLGSVLIFSQTLMHGNRVNLEPETRWSMNCRFKSLFSPYADKKLGDFFEPITLRAATRIGAAYQLPQLTRK